MMELDADEKTEIRETAGGEFDGLTDEEVVFVTSVSLWFSIVSMAMTVFPVCLSPMINSLCPLPMGIIESIALSPVCKGL